VEHTRMYVSVCSSLVCSAPCSRAAHYEIRRKLNDAERRREADRDEVELLSSYRSLVSLSTLTTELELVAYRR